MKVHIIGPAGSGKSTLARSLAAQHGATWHDLDEVVYGSGGERATEEIAERLAGILGSDAWVTEGAYRTAWLRPVLDAANRVIWLDVSLPLCLWRIFKRHVVAELRRNNDHPGWGKLFRFMNYTRRVHPQSREETAELLAECSDKVVRCHSTRTCKRCGRCYADPASARSRRIWRSYGR